MPLNPLNSLGPLKELSGIGDIVGNNPTETQPISSNSGGRFSGELAQIVTILLGLLLIAAGLFSFRSVREYTGYAAKAAASAA